jgi:hypothetical protein
MAITFVQKHWAPPVNWRETLGPRVMTLDVPELDAAFNMAAVILKNRTDAEIQEIVDLLVQSIAVAKGTSKSNTPAPDPRAIYEIYCTEGQTPPEVSIMDMLAVGTLLALARAHRTLNEVKITHQEEGVGKALATARAFSEWLYIVHLLNSNVAALELLSPLQIRAAAKKKITQLKVKAGKKGARTKYKADKTLIEKYYQDNNLDSMSVNDAALKIETAKLTLSKYSTIKTYIYAYKKNKNTQ